MDIIRQIERERMKPQVPSYRVGDTVDVHYRIREGDKDRVQIFNGTIIAARGTGIRKSILVRRLVAGEGVERMFPLHSPRVVDIVVKRKGQVRRAKLYYLRGRVGKATKVRETFAERTEPRQKAQADAAPPAARQGTAAPAVAGKAE
jgi:large subunit ribosomal protein L19